MLPSSFTLFYLWLQIRADLSSGGGCTKDVDGNLVQLKDQGGDNSTMASLVNSKESGLAVGLIVGMFLPINPEIW